MEKSTATTIGTIAGLASIPFLVFAAALLRGLLLFWPFMVILGMLHSWVPQVPAYGWQVCFLILALTGLLFPTSSNRKSDTK